MKNPVLLRTVVCIAIMTTSLLASYQVFAVVEILDSGARYVIKPSETICRDSVFEEPERFRASAQASCSTNDGTIYVDARTGNRATGGPVLPVSVGANALFEYRFEVLDDTGAITQSFVPITVRVPVVWAVRILNESFNSRRAAASVDLFLRMRMSPRGDPTKLGPIVEDAQIVTATHGGVGNCLSIPGSAIAVVNIAIKCVAEKVYRLEGDGSVSISTVVEVGRTYTIQLGASARASKKVTLNTATGLAPAQIAGSLIASSPPALEWNRMIVQIGTDPATVVADMQGQIDELMEGLLTLQEDLNAHLHDHDDD